jgi:hypothetical protein
MASVNGRELDLSAPGAVLFLTTPARREWVEQLPDGVTVVTADDSTAVIVRGLDSNLGIDGTTDAARRVTNEALDLMAVRSLGTYTLTDLTSPTVVWALRGGLVRMRTSSDVHATFSSTVGGPPSPAPTRWHASMRYFRLSQTTSDLFDAFRNLYLAIESILSRIEPMRRHPDGRPAEPERTWLKRALATAEQTLIAHNPGLLMGRYLQPASAASGPAAVQAVMAELYTSVRTTVFHAKDGRTVALPQHAPDRAAVADALGRYGRFYLELAEPELDARFLQSGLAYGGFDRIVDGSLPQWTIGASGTTWATLDDFDVAAAASLLPMTTRRAPEFDAPFAAAVRGELNVADIPNGFVIASIGARDRTGGPLTVEALGSHLTLELVDVWEHVLTFRVRNSGLKVDYET